MMGNMMENKSEKGKREIPKKKLLMLDASDFELENVIPKKDKKKTMGFCVAS